MLTQSKFQEQLDLGTLQYTLTPTQKHTSWSKTHLEALYMKLLNQPPADSQTCLILGPGPSLKMVLENMSGSLMGRFIIRQKKLVGLLRIWVLHRKMMKGFRFWVFIKKTEWSGC